MKLPSVENCWRSFWNLEQGKLESLEAEARALCLAHGIELPAEIPLPGIDLLSHFEGKQLFGKDEDYILRRISTTFSAYAAYRSHKVVYELERNFWDAQLDARWPREISPTHLNFPHSCLVFEVEKDALENGPFDSWSFFVFHDLHPVIGQGQHALELKFGMLDAASNDVYLIGSLDMSKPTLGEAWEAALEKSDLNLIGEMCAIPAQAGEIKMALRFLLNGLVNLVLSVNVPLEMRPVASDAEQRCPILQGRTPQSLRKSAEANFPRIVPLGRKAS
jgi:hypothetical protein